ncbi:cadherin repeat domain-containing protein [Octadecabacter sp.]|nr:cadherin repeat domain-containing protein [Octadecabacter sp.]
MMIRKNERHVNKRKNANPAPVKLLSPLALLTLAACKGGNGDSSTSFTISSTALKGQLSNAFVFVDLDGDGQHSQGEPSTYTDPTGNFTLETSDRSANVIVRSTTSTTDASTGAIASGIKLIGNADGEVVSLATTLLSQSDMSPEDIASVLGLDGIDLTNYDPFDPDADASAALKFEQISHQIQNILTATKSAAEGSGLDEVAAFNSAVQSVVAVTKASVEAAAASSEAGEIIQELDFSDTDTIAAVKENVREQLLTNDDVDSAVLETKLASGLKAAENVNKEVANTTSLDGAKGAFSLGQLLSDQLDEANENPEATVSLEDPDIAAAEASNLAPTNIALSETSVVENSDNLSIGVVTAEDTSEVSFELVDTADASAFILSSDGSLSLKEAADFEAKDSYSLKVKATDTSGKASIGKISISVTDVNDDPTGSVTISGATSQGSELTAITTTLADEDGLGDLSYQWLRDGSDIDGATASTYTLTQNDVGATVSVKVSYTDDGGTAEEVVSTATATVTNTNDLPTGSITIVGTASQENELTVKVDALEDQDGLGALSYQWLRDGSNISGATSTAYTLVEADVGKNISVRVTYTDGYGASETVTSSETSTVTNRNDSPTGEITISGTAAENQTLTALSTLEDPDGLGELSYQWKADGADISNATNSTLTLSQNEVGKVITVTASYTDGGGTLESVTSAASLVVENVDDNPTGSVTISGTATEEQTLTLSSTVADEDGIDASTVSYQWYRDGSAISGATDTSYTLTQNDVDAAITAKQSYTDDFGNDHSVTSTATSAVSNVNDDPTGSVTISGTTSQGSELTAVTTTLADEDGLGGLSYQWLRDGSDIDGATASTYTLTQDDVGAQISTRVSYTDGGSASEAVESSPSSAVTNVNDDPTGSVTISGTANQGSELTAITTTLADDDGLGVLSYQWLRDGSDISGATESSYTLTQDDVGTAISVKVIYTDDGGTVEEVLSGASSAVTPPPAFDLSTTSTDNDVVTFKLYADELVDPDNDGIGAFEFTLTHDPSDLVIDVDSIAAASGFFSFPNHNATTGVLEIGGIKEPTFKDLSTPIVTFEATIIDKENPLNLAISNAFVDGVAQSDVIETFDLFSSQDILASSSEIIA